MRKKNLLYTPEQINEATETVRAHTMKLLKSLGKNANLIAYMLSPRRTAIDAHPSYNESVFENTFWMNITSREGLESDGTEGHTLLDLADRIKKGCFKIVKNKASNKTINQ